MSWTGWLAHPQRGRARRRGRRPRAAADVAAGGPASVTAASAASLLAGCAALPQGAAAWWGWGWFAALALALTSLLAYRLGGARQRQRAADELRRLRESLRVAEATPSRWHWHTDAGDRLQSWVGPDHRTAARCALFGRDDDPGSRALRDALRARLPFAALRVQAAQAVDGSRQWELAGVPRTDAQGVFAGFVGQARPLDADDALQAAAALLLPALRATEAPAVVAWDHGTGWRLAEVNAAAAARWAALAPGLSPAELDDAPGPALAAALAAPAAPGGVAVVEGWRVAAVAVLPSGGRGAVLVLAGAVGVGAADADGLESLSFTVSHDLRAPIRVVEGFTRIVKEDYGARLDRVGNDHLDRVLGAAARMNLMIDALLTLARLSSQPLSQQPVNLSQLAGYVVDELRRTTPAHAVEVEIEDGLTARGDPTLLRLVLENLLGNAWKYSARSEPARISFGTAAPVVDAQRRRGAGAAVAYVVRDNGAGFDMRAADRLFGLFQRLHSASDFAGHGVGLASVQRIVRRHGGEVWAEAAPGRGAAFFFTLGPG